MVGKLPDGIGERSPAEHAEESVVFWGSRIGEFDVVYGGKARLENVWGRKVDEAMESDGWHDVNEERSDLVKGVEYQTVTPHDDGHCVVAVGQAVGCNE